MKKKGCLFFIFVFLGVSSAYSEISSDEISAVVDQYLKKIYPDSVSLGEYIERNEMSAPITGYSYRAIADWSPIQKYVRTPPVVCALGTKSPKSLRNALAAQDNLFLKITGTPLTQAAFDVRLEKLREQFPIAENVSNYSRPLENRDHQNVQRRLYNKLQKIPLANIKTSYVYFQKDVNRLISDYTKRPNSKPILSWLGQIQKRFVPKFEDLVNEVRLECDPEYRVQEWNRFLASPQGQLIAEHVLANTIAETTISPNGSFELISPSQPRKIVVKFSVKNWTLYGFVERSALVTVGNVQRNERVVGSEDIYIDKLNLEVYSKVTRGGFEVTSKKKVDGVDSFVEEIPVFHYIKLRDKEYNFKFIARVSKQIYNNSIRYSLLNQDYYSELEIVEELSDDSLLSPLKRL